MNNLKYILSAFIFLISFNLFAQFSTIEDKLSEYIGTEIDITEKVTSIENIKLVKTDKHKVKIESSMLTTLLSMGMVDYTRAVKGNVDGILLEGVRSGELLIGNILIFPVFNMELEGIRNLIRNIKLAIEHGGPVLSRAENNRKISFKLNSLEYGNELTKLSDFLGKGTNETLVKLGTINILYQTEYKVEIEKKVSTGRMWPRNKSKVTEKETRFTTELLDLGFRGINLEWVKNRKKPIIQNSEIMNAGNNCKTIFSN